jgi:hypothetical protein
LLEQILQLSKDMSQSLENQNRMLSHDDASLSNQESILTTLKAAIKQRDRLLRESLEKRDATH